MFNLRRLNPARRRSILPRAASSIKKSKTAGRFILSAAFAVLVPQVAKAAVLVWDADGASGSPTGGSGLWDTTGAFWDNAGTLQAWNNATNDTAVFGGAGGTVTLGAPVTAGGVVFNTGYTFAGGNTLTLAGAAPSISVTNSGTLATVQTNVALAANAIFSGAGDLNLNTGIISGAGFGFSKQGTGTLTLGGANIFSGPVSLRGGVTSIGAQANLGDASATNTLTLAGGTLQATSGFNLGATRGVVIGLGDGAIDVTGSNNLTVDGALSLAPGLTGGVVLTKTGTGTLTLTGTNNTVPVLTTVNGGAVSVASVNNLGSGRVTLNGGALAFTGTSTSLANGVVLGTNGGTINVSTAGQTLTSTTVVTGSGSLTKTGAGTLQLNVLSTYAGATNINEGTLSGGIASFLPSRTQLSIATGATLNMNGSNTSVASLSGGGTVHNTGAAAALTVGNVLGNVDSTYSGIFTSATAANLTLTKNGGGTLILTNSGTAGNATGAWTMTAGTVKLDYANAGNQIGNIINGGTLATFAGGTLNVTGRSGSNVAQGLGNVSISAGGSKIKMVPGSSGTTTLTLGSVPVSGATSTTAGGSLLVEAPTGTAVRTTTDVTNGTYGGRIVFSDGNAYNWAANGGGSSPRTLTGYTGYSPLMTAGNNPASNVLQTGTMPGGMTTSDTVNSLKIATTGAGQNLDLNGTALTLANGGLLFTGADDFEILSTVGGGALRSGTAAIPDLIVHQYGTGVLKLSTPYTGGGATGAATLTKAGPGTLILTAANTYAGGTIIGGGTLSISNNNQLGATATSTITINDGATLKTTADVNTGTHAYTLSGGNATFDVASGTTLTVGGVITGAGGLSLNTGTLLLNAAATYTGPTFIGAGATLKGGATGFINATAGGILTVAGGGTVDMLNFTLNVGGLSGAGTITNSGGTAVNLAVGSTTNTASTTQDSTFAGTLSGAINLVKSGGAVLTLNNPATYTGSSNITNGGIVFGVNNALPATPLVMANNVGPASAFLDLAGHNWTSQTITFYGTSVGPATQASLNIGAGGTLTLGGNVTMTNATSAANSGLPAFITGGTIDLSATRTFAIADSPNAATDLTVTSVISSTGGNFGISKTGAGTLLLTGANTYAGGTTVNGAGGVLALGGAGTLGATTGALTMTAGTLDLNGTSQTVGAFSGVAAGTIRNSATGTASTLTVGTGTASTSLLSYAGTLVDGGGTLALAKNGAGILTLTGANTYTGGTQVNEGILVFGNTAAQPTTGTTQVAASGTLGLGVGGSGFYSVANVDALFANTLPNVNMAVGASVALDTAAGDFDYTTSQSAARGLVKLGANVLTLSGANGYTGGTTVMAGTLAISSDANLGATSGGLTLLTGTTLRVTGTNNPTSTRAVSLLGTSTFDIVSAGNTYTVTSPLALNGALTKTGLGTLTLGGNVTGAATSISVNGGALQTNGVVNTGTGVTNVGTSAGTQGLLRVPTGGDYTTFLASIGNNATGVGSVVIDGGSFATSNPTTSTGVVVGNGGFGGILVGGGVFSTRRLETSTSILPSAVASIQVNGGTLNTSEYIILRNYRSDLTVTNGTLNRVGASQNIGIAFQGDATTFTAMTVAGGLVDNTGKNVTFGEQGNAAQAQGSGALNLNGGILRTNQILTYNVAGKNTKAVVNFNGGTLQAAANTADFIGFSGTGGGSTMPLVVNGAFGSFAGGAVIDSNGFNVTLAQPLQAPTGNGVTNLTLGSNGSGYIGAPYVEISGGGGGTGATGYAVVDTNPASATYGQVTGIVLTNPGTGYTSTPTVTLLGGGGTGAGATAAGIAANTSGGLTKIGDGTLVLAAANTFTGATTVNGGTLSISPAALPNTSALNVGSTGSANFDLYQDGVGAPWNVPTNVSITLGSLSTSGGLGFQLGTASDSIVFNGTGGLTINSGGGFINATALTGFGIGSYNVITGANSIAGLGNLQLGTLPAGFSYSLTNPATGTIALNVAAIAAGDFFWTGDRGSSWATIAGGNSNWSTTQDGLTDPGYTPGSANIVHFSADGITTPATTTLDTAFSIQGIKFLSTPTANVTIAAGTGGTLTLGADGLEVKAGGPATTTISAPVTLGAAQTWKVTDSNSAVTISGAVSGGTTMSTQANPGMNVGLTITGAGTVNFANTANTFSGDILVDGATYVVDHLTDWGKATTASADSHTIILDNGGTVRIGASLNPTATTSTGYNLLKINSGGGKLEVGNGFTYTMDDAGQLYGAGTLTKTGLGTLVLRNQGSTSPMPFDGALIIAEGLLQMSTSSGSVGGFGSTTVGTTIKSGAALNLAGQVIILANADVLTISGTGLAANPQGVIFNNSGTGASYAGDIILADDSTVGVTTTGGLTLSGGITGAHTLTNASSGSGTVTLSGVIGADVTGIVQNSATSTLSFGSTSSTGPTHLWSGGLYIKAGQVTAANSVNSLGANHNLITLGDTSGSANTTLAVANSLTYPQPIKVAGGNTGVATIIAGTGTGSVVMAGSISLENHDVVLSKNGTTGNSQFTGSISGVGNVTLRNNVTTTGIITLAGDNTFRGTLTIDAGVVQLARQNSLFYNNSAAAWTAANIVVSPGATLVFNAGGAGEFTSSDLTQLAALGTATGGFTNGSTLGIDTANAGGLFTLSGNIANPNGGANVLGLTKVGIGTLVLSGNNTYTGQTTITAGTLSGASSASNLVFNGGVYEGSGTFTRSLGTAGGEVRWAAGTNGGFSARGGAYSVTLGGASPLVWDSTPNFVSGAGQLLFGSSTTADDAVTLTNNINLNDPGSAVTRTVQVLDNTTVTTDKAVLSGIISGGSNAALAKTGAGVLELSGANTYTGSTLVSAGTLVVSSIGGTGVTSSNLGAGNATISIGSGSTTSGILTYIGVGETTDRAINLAATTTGAATLNSSGTGALTWQGNVSSAGTTKNFTLGGDYTGSANTFSGTISIGTGNLIKAGAGTWALTSANTYGNTTINNGTLRLSGAGTLGSGTLTMGGGGAGTSSTLDIGSGRSVAPTGVTYTSSGTNPSGMATISGAGTLNLGTGLTVTVGDTTTNAVDMSWETAFLTGSGTLTKAGAGTLDIGSVGANNFTGSYQINAGAMRGLGGVTNNLILNGGVFEGSGTFTRSIGTGTGQVQWLAGTAGGGFSAAGAPLSVTLASAPSSLVWASTPMFVGDGAPLIFGSTSADNVVTFTHDIDLNLSTAPGRTVQVIDNTTATTDRAELSGVISGAFTGTGVASGFTKTGNGTLRLTGANTFSAPVTVTAGTLEFNDVTNSGGAASNLGQGTSLLLGGGTLSFVGSTSQSTDRPITLTASSGLGANGSGTATMEYTGAITANNGAGTGYTLSLTGSGAGGGILRGVITQQGTSADLDVNSGTWTLANTAPHVIADDIHVTNPGAVLKLGATGSISFTSGTSNFLYARNGGTLVLTANEVVSSGLEGVLIGIETAGETANFDMSGFNLTAPRFDVGNLTEGFSGNVYGGGVLTINSTTTDYSAGIRLFRGDVSSNLAGTAPLLKQGKGTVTLSGDNSGLTGTPSAATRIDSGELILKYSTSNATKLNTAAALDLRGGDVTLRGGVLADTVQDVASTTLASGSTNIGGSSTVSVSSLGAFSTTLNLKAISRAASAGTLRFVTGTGGIITTTSVNNATTGLLGSTTGAAYATINDGTGTYFVAVDGTGKIVPVTYASAKNDVSTWLATDNVTNGGTGFTGTIGRSSINSLRFDAVGASTLNMGPLGLLTIASGGILQTNNVTTGQTVISGGRLVSGANELVITTDSATSQLRISSVISGAQGITKTGAGTLILEGKNHYSSPTNLQNGTLIISGGNAIGDRSVVTLADDHYTTLQVLNDETIGGLGGGSASAGLNDFATVNLGSNTLTFTGAANASYAGVIFGDGRLIKTGGNTQSFGGANTFSGDLIVNGGAVTLAARAIANFANIGSVTVNAATLTLDFNSGSEGADKINNAAPVTLLGATVVANSDRNDGSKTETLGAVTLLGGANTFTLQANDNAGTTARQMAISATSLVRQNHATLLVRGNNLGDLAANGIVNSGRFVATTPVSGAGGAAGTTSISIVPWAIGDVTASESTAHGTGDSFITSPGTSTGWRPLDLTTEYEQLVASGGVTVGNNVRYSGATGLTLNGTTARLMNALLLDNTSTTAAITLAGAGSSLNVASGAFLFTGTQGITLNGFSGITTTGAANEYVLHVPNTAAAGVTIGSPFTSVGAALTKSGAGTLFLTATGSTYMGATTINQGVVVIDSLDKLGNSGSGGLFFNGGTLRFGAAFDLSAAPVTFGVSDTATVDVTAGGTFDTNGFNITLGSSIGGAGNGGFTKIGAGILTLNAPANYGGATNISVGTLAYGVANALPTTTDLTLGSGAVLAVGANAATLDGLTLAGSASITGSAPVLFTGNVLLSAGDRTLTINNSGTTTFDGDILQLSDSGTARTLTMSITGTGQVTVNNDIIDGPAAASSVTKSGAGSLELTGANSYSGTTSISAGTLTLSGSNDGTGNTTVTGGTLQFNSDSNGGLASGTLTLSNGAVQALNDDRSISNNVTLSTVTVSGTEGLAIGGTVTGASGANRLLTSSINGGTLQLSNVAINSDATAARALTIAGTGSTRVNGVISNGNGDAFANGVIITNTGTTTFGAANTYTGNTTISAGTLAMAADQAMTGSLLFGSSTSTTTVGTLDLSLASASFGSILAQGNSTSDNQIVIGTGKTLSTAGAVTIGTTSANTRIKASGAGAFNVNNPTTGTTPTFLIGGTGTTNIAVADFSELAEMNVTLAAPLQVGSTTSDGGAGFGTLKLAVDSTITAPSLLVGGGGSYNGGVGQVNSLVLGSGDNILNVGTFNIGTGSRDLGSVTFGGSTGTIKVRSAVDPIDGRATFALGGLSASTGVASNGNKNVFDVSGHYADLKFGAVTIGTQNRGGTLTSEFSFDDGLLDMSSLSMSTRTGDSSNGAGAARITTSTVNLGGGKVTIVGSTTMAGAAGTYAANPAPVMNATINISGGEVTFGGAINMASYTATGGTGTGSSTALLNLTGGETTVNGNITKATAPTTNATATVKLSDTAKLNMTGKSIGTATNAVDLVLESGTLLNLGQFNGGGAITKTTDGTLNIDGTNGYTGAVNVSGGVLNVLSTSGLGTTAAGTTVDTGATLNFSGVAYGNEALTLNGVGFGGVGALTGTGTASHSGAITLATASSIGVALGTDQLTLSGAIDGAGGLTKVGAGTLVLSGANNYQGGTTIALGTLRIGASEAIPHGASAGNLDITGGVLDLGGFNESINGLNGTGTIDNSGVGASVLTVGFSNADGTFSGTIQNTGGAVQLIKTGTGTLTLSGTASTFSGGVTVNDGTLVIGANGTATSGPLGTGTLTLANGVSISGAGTTVANAVQVNGDFAFTGAGAAQNLTLSGATTLSNSSHTITVNDTDATSVDNADLVATISGAVGGAGAIVKAGLGTLVLSGDNDYTGSTTVNGGILRVGSTDAIPAGSELHIGDAGTFDLNGKNTTVGSLRSTVLTAGNARIINTGSAATLTAGGDGSSTTYGGTIAGPTTLEKQGGGALTLNNGGSTFTGGVIVSGGTLVIGANSDFGPTQGPLGTGTLTLTAGSSIRGAGTDVNNAVIVNGDFTFAGVDDSDNLTLSGNVQLGTATRTITVADDDNTTNDPHTATISGIIDGTMGFTKGGKGILVVSGANTYTGTTTVDEGILRVGAANSLPTGTALVLNASGNFDLNGLSQRVASLAGLGTVTSSHATGNSSLIVDGSANTEFLGTITNGPGTGVVNFIKTGTGTLVLGSANSYKGATSITGGILNIRNNLSLGTIDNGTSVDGGTLELQNNIAVSGETLLLAGANGGTGALRNLSGSNTWAGPVFLTNDATVNTVADLLTVSGALNGSSTLTKTGAGTLVLSGDNATFSGLVEINGGTLRAGATNNLGDGTATNSLAINGGTLEATATFNLGNDRGIAIGTSGAGFKVTTGSNLTVPGSITSATPGTGALTKTDDGTLTLSGDNTGFSGSVAINGGVVSINSSASLGDESATNTLSIAGGTLQATEDVDLANTRTIAVGTGGATLDVSSGKTLGVFGSLSGGAGLTKIGAGTVELSGLNTGFSGAVAINGGTLSIGESDHLGNASATNTLSIAGGTLQATGDVDLTPNRTIAVGAGGANLQATGSSTLTASGAITGSTSLTKSGTGTVVLSGNNSAFTGSTTITGGTLSVSAANHLGGTSGVTFNGTGVKLAVTDTFTSNHGLTFTTGGSVDVAAEKTLTYTGAISGSAGLTKSGAGTMLVNSDNGAYTGPVTIEAGTFGGTGAVGGAVNVDGGAIIAPGASIGTLSMSTLSLDNNATLKIELDLGLANVDGGSDRLSLTSTGPGVKLELASTAVLDIVALGTAGSYSIGDHWTIATYSGTGTWTGVFRAPGFDYDLVDFTGDIGTATTFQLPNGGPLVAIDYNFADTNYPGMNSVALVVVPEPGSMASLAGAAGLLLGLQRFRRRTAKA